MLKKENKKAFIPYICAGDPDLKTTEQLVYTLESAGADILELGIPFSDPLADGPVIQAASVRALNSDFNLENFFNTVKKIRKNSQLPLVAMVYYNTIFGCGRESFIKNCVESGIDGIIIPDLPYEEYNEMLPYISGTDSCLIPLIAVTSLDRLSMLCKNARGFIYAVSSLGVTGERVSFNDKTRQLVEQIKQYTDLPVCVGFGISKRNDVEYFEKFADGVIVGSAIVRKIYECSAELPVVKAFIQSLICIS